MSTAFSRLRNLWGDSLGLMGVILRKNKRSNPRNDPSLTAADGEPDDTIDAEPNASLRLVGDATNPDRVLAVRVSGVWYYAQLTADADTGVLDAHLDGSASRHDATEVDYERIDGSKKNIAAGSDTVEAALTNLDDATGLLADLTTTSKTSTVVAINEVRGLFGTANAAAANGSGVVLTVSAEGAVKRVRLTLTNTSIPLTDNPGVVAYGSLKVLDFSEGFVTVLGVVANLTVSRSSAGLNADWDGDFGIGTATADSGAALATNEQNVVPTTPIPQAVDGTSTAKGGTTSPPFTLNGSVTPVDLYLNFLVDDADHDVTGTPCDMVVNGTIDITYCLLGDV